MALFLTSVRRIDGMANRYDTAIVTNIVFPSDAPQTVRDRRIICQACSVNNQGYFQRAAAVSFPTQREFRVLPLVRALAFAN